MVYLRNNAIVLVSVRTDGVFVLLATVQQTHRKLQPELERTWNPSEPSSELPHEDSTDLQKLRMMLS